MIRKFILILLTISGCCYGKPKTNAIGIEIIPPNQNAFNLLAEIPPDLRNLPYAIYPTNTLFVCAFESSHPKV